MPNDPQFFNRMGQRRARADRPGQRMQQSPPFNPGSPPIRQAPQSAPPILPQGAARPGRSQSNVDPSSFAGGAQQSPPFNPGSPIRQAPQPLGQSPPFNPGAPPIRPQGPQPSTPQAPQGGMTGSPSDSYWQRAIGVPIPGYNVPGQAPAPPAQTGQPPIKGSPPILPPGGMPSPQMQTPPLSPNATSQPKPLMPLQGTPTPPILAPGQQPLDPAAEARKKQLALSGTG